MKWLKQWGFYVILVYIIFSSIVNVVRQWTTLEAGQRRLLRLETKKQEMQQEIRKYTKLAEEATSSEIIERKAREYFGVGRENDYWLIMPPAEKMPELVEKFSQTNQKPNIVAWWELLTQIGN
ncbi:MAG: septum formation initiator family protein [Microgenomates group bacterium]